MPPWTRRLAAAIVATAPGLCAVGCGADAGPCEYASIDWRGGATVEDADDIAALAGSCIHIGGDLEILGTRLRDLDGLQGIVGVGGNLRIGADGLTTTRGLDGLQFVTGSVLIGGATVMSSTSRRTANSG